MSSAVWLEPNVDADSDLRIILDAILRQVRNAPSDRPPTLPAIVQINIARMPYKWIEAKKESRAWKIVWGLLGLIIILILLRQFFS